MTTEPEWLRRYGPRQLCDLLGLTEWQRERGLLSGVIPRPDTPDVKWSREVVQRLWPLRTAIRRSVGIVPDLGEVRAAEHLTAVTGVEVESHALPELARQGLILVVDAVEKYHGSFPLYCGRTLESWPAGRTEEIVAANVAGERLITDQVVDRLGARRSDVDHLVRLGWLIPVTWVRSSRTPKKYAPDVPLYRAGDVSALLLAPEIDWNAVRGLGKGKRSPLASLPDRKAAAG